MSKEASGTFKIIAWNEKPYAELENGGKLTRASVELAYTGGIEGTSTIEYLMAYRNDEWAAFVGQERITGAIAGSKGSFLIQHRGTFESGVARSTWTVVPSSGTESLRSIVGHGTFVADKQGRADYTFSYDI
jgi:Protein of unknown function (DUF3224)